MIISINNAATQTIIVEIGLLLALILSIRRSKAAGLFPIELTNELKGLAILMIVLSHIGYFLVSDKQFLVPLSNFAGVGVDLFLVLSGYGLAASALRKPLTVAQFYFRRLSRIYLPVIVTLLIFLIIDGLFLHLTYPLSTTLLNLAGIFPEANLYVHIDSPLWYITFLLANYLIFPLVFHKRFPFLSALAMALAVWLFIAYLPLLNLISPGLIIGFYKLHFAAFPVGMALAALLNQPPAWLKSVAAKIMSRLKSAGIKAALRFVGLILFVGVLYYTYINSHVGEFWGREAATSVVTALAIIAVFILKKIDIKVLAWLGAVSFEIYLLHWPLLWRYNFLYGYLPAGIATLLYLGIFFGLGYLFSSAINKLLNRSCTLTLGKK